MLGVTPSQLVLLHHCCFYTMLNHVLHRGESYSKTLFAMQARTRANTRVAHPLHALRLMYNHCQLLARILHQTISSGRDPTSKTGPSYPYYDELGHSGKCLGLGVLTLLSQPGIIKYLKITRHEPDKTKHCTAGKT